MPSSGKSPLELLAQTCNSIGKEVKPKAIPQAAEEEGRGQELELCSVLPNDSAWTPEGPRKGMAEMEEV